MSQMRYTEEFKIEAVREATEEGLPVAEVAARCGVSSQSIYQWIKRYSRQAEDRRLNHNLRVENHRLRVELRRISEERDILKKAAAYFARQSG